MAALGALPFLSRAVTVKLIGQGHRCLFTQSGIGMDQFIRLREVTAVRLGSAQESIRKRIIEDVAKEDKQIFSEDLKNLLYIADNDEEINAVLNGLKKYYSHGSGYSNFHFGAPILRMLSFFNKTEKAIEVFSEKTTEAAFKDSASCLVLMNHLLERRRFDDAVKIFELAKSRGFLTATGKPIPSDVLMLLVEALFCLNTPEAFVKLEKILKDAKHSDCNITLRTIGLASLFAIKQKRPDVALEITGYGRNQSSPLFRNIKAICFADLGRVEEAMQIVHVITEAAATPGVSQRYERHVYPTVMNHIRQAVEKINDSGLKDKLDSLVRIIYDSKLMTTNDLEQFLLSPINRTYLGIQRDQQQASPGGYSQAGMPYGRFDQQGSAQQQGFMNADRQFGGQYGQHLTPARPEFGSQPSTQQYTTNYGPFSYQPPSNYNAYTNQQQQQPSGMRPSGGFNTSGFARPPNFAGGFGGFRPPFAPHQASPSPYAGSAGQMNNVQGMRPPLRSPLSGAPPNTIRNFSNPNSNRPGPNDEDL